MKEGVNCEAFSIEKHDLSEVNFPATLDLRNKVEVVTFLNSVVKYLNKNIHGFEKGAYLLVGSVSRNSASNNSDIDIIPLVPTFGFDRIAVKNLFMSMVSAYGIELDGFQNSISPWEDYDNLKRLHWFQSMVDDNTVVIAADDQRKKEIELVLNIGRRGNTIIRDWPANHVYDPSAPAKKLDLLSLYK